MRGHEGSVYLVWGALALPAAALGAMAWAGHATVDDALHASGALSGRLLVLALAITPLRLLFGPRGWIRWLLARRRAIGVASFLYAALHGGCWAFGHGWFANLTRLDIGLGWLALVVMVPIAMTSNDWAMARLRHQWKTVQRLAYVSAIVMVMHWAALGNGWMEVSISVAPLVALYALRVWRWRGATAPSKTLHERA